MADITITNESKNSLSVTNESQNSLSVSNESKNSLSVTNLSKPGVDLTWDEATYTWDDSLPSTWDSQRIAITKTSKNPLTVSNDSKN